MATPWGQSLRGPLPPSGGLGTSPTARMVGGWGNDQTAGAVEDVSGAASAAESATSAQARLIRSVGKVMRRAL